MSSASVFVYDPYARDFADRAHLVYDRLREDEAWHWAPGIQEWIVTRYADAKAILRDSTLLPPDVAGGVRITERESGRPLPALRQLVEEMVFFHTGPGHLQARRFLGRVLNQRPVTALRPVVESIAAELGGQLRSAGGGDLIRDFARRLPLRVMGGMLGVAEAEMEFLTDCAEGVFAVFEREIKPAQFAALNAQVAMAVDLLAGVCAERMASPREDGLSLMLQQARMEGIEDGRVVAVRAFFLFIAGLDTTMTFLGRSMQALLANPGEVERWRSGQVSSDAALEELLRFTSPVTQVVREVTKSVHAGGQNLATGQRVTVLLEAVNRDPAIFVEPHRLDLGRATCPHLAFGDGVHACLGASLARLNGTVGLHEFMRLPQMRVLGVIDAGWRRVLRPVGGLSVAF